MNDPLAAWVAAMRRADYPAAWAISRRLLAARDPASRDDHAQPPHCRWVWDGRPVDQRHVLVRCYHGLGDTIQFARFLPMLAERATSMIVACQPALVPLIATMPALARHAGRCLVVPDRGETLRPLDIDLEIGEIDFALSAPPSSVRPPYLAAPGAILPAGTIGLCTDAGDWDGDRSIPEELLAPLAARRPCLTLAARPTRLPVLNPGGCPMDMTATAALVGACDLIVTVDTMIAHLAGALGRPTWLLLKADPDWRWNPAKRGSDWYPAIRQFVQPRPGDWSAAVATLLEDIDRLRPVPAMR